MKFPIVGGSNADMGTAQTFAYLCATFGQAWTTTEANRQIPLSEDITFTDLKVMLDTAPGTGNSRTFTVRKNGVDTAATVTISDTATSAAWNGTVVFAAGDLIALAATSTGTPTAATNTYWHTFMTTVGSKGLVMGGAVNNAVNTAVNYCNPFGASAWTTTSADQDVVVPTGGNLTKLYVASSASPGSAGKSYACCVRLNNTTDVLTATIASGTTAANATGSQALAAGDTIQFKETPTGTPNGVKLAWCATFEPTTDGETIIGFGVSTNLSTSATQYEQPVGVGGGGYVSVEANRFLKFPGGITFKKLFVRLSAAAGTLATRTITLRDNAASSTLTVAVTGASATTGSDTAHTVAHTADQTVGIQSAISTAPAAAQLHIGFVIATTQPQVLSPTGAASDVGFGSPVLAPQPVVVAPTGISGDGGRGTPTLVLGAVVLAATGAASEGAAGAPVVSPGPVAVVVVGAASDAAVGAPVLAVGAVIVAAAGVRSDETDGTPTVVPGIAVLVAVGAAGEEQAGSPTITVAAVVLVAVGAHSDEAGGAPALALTPVLGTAGASSDEHVGMPTVVPGVAVIVTGGVSSDAATGKPVVALIGVVLRITEPAGLVLVQAAARRRAELVAASTRRRAELVDDGRRDAHLTGP